MFWTKAEPTAGVCGARFAPLRVLFSFFCPVGWDLWEERVGGQGGCATPHPTFKKPSLRREFEGRPLWVSRNALLCCRWSQMWYFAVVDERDSEPRSFGCGGARLYSVWARERRLGVWCRAYTWPERGAAAIRAGVCVRGVCECAGSRGEEIICVRAFVLVLIFVFVWVCAFETC